MLGRHRHASEGLAPSTFGDRIQQRRAHQRLQIHQQAHQIAASGIAVIDDRHQLLVVARRERCRQRCDFFGGDQTVNIEDIGLGYLRPTKRNHLVKDRLRIAHPSVRHPRDTPERRLRDGNLLVDRDFLQPLHDQVGRDRLQIETLTTRNDRRQHLLRIGRRKDKLHVRRRLLQRLEQSIERLRRKHVHFVDDVDLEFPLRRCVADRVTEVAHLVDAVVRGTIDLHHVEMRPLRDRDARRIVDIKVCLGPVGAIERLRENARRRSLARATRPDEKISMGDATAVDGIGQRAHHVILTDEVGEGLRPPLARDNLIGARHIL